MEDLTDGSIKGWPVSLMIEREGGGGRAFAANCVPYSKDDSDEEPPHEVWLVCDEITMACEDMTPAKALRKAKSLGFVPDEIAS
jgi:hypothetical protein